MNNDNNVFTAMAVFETSDGEMIVTDCPENYPDCSENVRAIVEIMAAEEIGCDESDLILYAVF